MSVIVNLINKHSRISNISLSLNEVLGEGGSGTVYKEIIKNEVFAVKIYSDIKKFEKEKIEYMVNNEPVKLFEIFGDVKLPSYSWPQYLISTDANDTNFIGYITPYVHHNESYSLDYFYDFNLSKKLKIKDRIALTNKRDIIINICKLLEELHRKNIFFIDLKPQNIRVYEKNLKVSFLDCDGYSILNSENNKRYEATMVSTDYISPELLNSNLSVTFMNENQDRYALAVLIFQLLNNGIHPFQGIQKINSSLNNTNDEKAANYLYPYGQKSDERIEPLPQSIHTTFLDDIRFCFDRAFTPNNNRPSAREWRELFERIDKELLITSCDKHPTDYFHLKFRDKACPACIKLNTTKVNFSKSTNNPNTNNILPKQKNINFQNISRNNIYFIVCGLFVTLYFILFMHEKFIENYSKSKNESSFIAVKNRSFITASNSNCKIDVTESEKIDTGWYIKIDGGCNNVLNNWLLQGYAVVDWYWSSDNKKYYTFKGYYKDGIPKEDSISEYIDYEKGRIYEGLLQNLNSTNFYNVYNLDKKTIYIGPIDKNWRKQGWGNEFNADESRYEGNFKDDKRNGFGVMTYKNGNKLTGWWENDFYSYKPRN